MSRLSSKFIYKISDMSIIEEVSTLRCVAATFEDGLPVVADAGFESGARFEVASIRIISIRSRDFRI